MAIENLIKENLEFTNKILLSLGVNEKHFSKMSEIYNQISKNPLEYKNISFHKFDGGGWNIRVDLKKSLEIKDIEKYIIEKNLCETNKIYSFPRKEEGHIIYFENGGDAMTRSKISLSLHNPINL